MKDELVLALVTVILLGTALSAAPLAPCEQELAARGVVGVRSVANNLRTEGSYLCGKI